MGACLVRSIWWSMPPRPIIARRACLSSASSKLKQPEGDTKCQKCHPDFSASSTVKSKPPHTKLLECNFSCWKVDESEGLARMSRKTRGQKPHCMHPNMRFSGLIQHNYQHPRAAPFHVPARAQTFVAYNETTPRTRGRVAADEGADDVNSGRRHVGPQVLASHRRRTLSSVESLRGSKPMSPGARPPANMVPGVRAPLLEMISTAPRVKKICQRPPAGTEKKASVATGLSKPGRGSWICSWTRKPRAPSMQMRPCLSSASRSHLRSK